MPSKPQPWFPFDLCCHTPAPWPKIVGSSLEAACLGGGKPIRVRNIEHNVHVYIYKYNGIHQWELSREVSKSNFRQYGQMEKQRWEESEKRSKEERRSEKRKSQKKDDAGARKGRKVANTLFSQ